MELIGRFLGATAWLLGTASMVLKAIVILNALLSWVRPDPSNPIVRFLDQVSDAVCDPVRRLFPTIIGGFDLAPLIVIVALQFLVDLILVPWLYVLSYKF